jgi:hypothetical protein
LFGSSPHAWFGPMPRWMPAFVSPAMLILWAPAGFRLTCYYYRGAYYKAFWADPPGCAVREPRNSYLGESAFPLILQNIHRYFLYVALLILVVLARRSGTLRHRRRHDSARGQRSAPWQLHTRVSLVASPYWGPQRHTGGTACFSQVLHVCECIQP